MKDSVEKPFEAEGCILSLFLHYLEFLSKGNKINIEVIFSSIILSGLEFLSSLLKFETLYSGYLQS